MNSTRSEKRKSEKNVEDGKEKQRPKTTHQWNWETNANRPTKYILVVEISEEANSSRIYVIPDSMVDYSFEKKLEFLANASLEDLCKREDDTGDDVMAMVIDTLRKWKEDSKVLCMDTDGWRHIPFGSEIIAFYRISNWR